MKRISLCLIFLFCFLSLSTEGRSEPAMQEDLTSMKEQLLEMQVKMAQMEAKIAAQQEQSIQQPVVQSKSKPQWLPEIGVLADTLFTLNSAKTDGDGADQLDVRELELVLGSDIDPYSRLDATVAFSTSEDEPVHLEEAYMTRFGLPLDTTARVGKFKPKVGKAILLHRDSLDTVDEPLVIQRYFSEEGFSKSGVDLSKNLNLPIPITQQLSIGVLEGGNHEDEGIFGETRRRPTLYGHLKNYVDITDQTGFELGVSSMTGSSDADASMEVQVLAADMTLTHDFNSTQKLKLQTEVFNVTREEPLDLDDNIWGAYGLADLRMHPQWSIGGRYDYVQPIELEASEGGRYDEGYTGYLTFHQSEFARWRVQFTHTDLATGKDDNAVYLQGTFAIGTHKHKIQ